MSTTRAGILVSSLSKRFGPVEALRDVSFQVDRGEIVALLGANGAGKSTLLRVLGTTVIADAGEALVAGRSVATEPRLAREASGFMLSDERSWYWRISGRRNLEFFAELHGLSRRAARSRAEELLAEMGLAEAADRPFGGYSSGMRLRLSFARALLSNPAVLLLDEPTRSLDPHATQHLRDLVRESAQRRTSAVLVATHDLVEAAALASRVLVMRRGTLTEIESGWTNADQLADRVLPIMD